jgi:hypothetical protein
VTEQTFHPSDRYRNTEQEQEHRRVSTRPARTPHEPDRMPVRAGRFLELLDRSRRGGRTSS